MQAQVGLFFLILLSLLRCCAGLDFINDTANAVEVSILGAFPVPDDFRMSLQTDPRGRYTLSRSSILRIGLYAMRRVALDGWTDRVVERDYSLPLFAETTVAVEAIPPYRGEFQNRVFMWGLAVCTTLLVQEGNFVEQFCYLGLGYPRNKHNVGIISYVNTTRVDPPAAIPLESNITQIAPQSSSSSNQISRREVFNGGPTAFVPEALDYSGWNSTASSIEDYSTDKNGKITVMAGDWGEQLVDLKLFVTVFESLIDRASKPDRISSIPDYTYTSEAAKIRINHHPRPEPGLPLPPYEVIAVGLGKLPGTMNVSGVFRECQFVMFLDGRPLVDGYVKLNTG